MNQEQRVARQAEAAAYQWGVPVILEVEGEGQHKQVGIRHPDHESPSVWVDVDGCSEEDPSGARMFMECDDCDGAGEVSFGHCTNGGHTIDPETEGEEECSACRGTGGFYTREEEA